MPKARRSRTTTHDQSARLDKRQFTLGGEPEHIEIGVEKDASATDLLDMMGSIEKPNLKKKEKQQLKHEAFLQRLESSHTPYSKSHVRRMKRKAREQIAGGLQDVALALPEVDDDLEDESNAKQSTNSMDIDASDKPKSSRKRKTALIGEGKGAPLSEKQRRQVLKTEKIRQPLLLATPEFASSPFKALRIHAQNTLVRHEKSRSAAALY